MYHFRLQRTDGSPADPPTYRSSTLNWRQGDTIPLTAERTLRVLGVRDDDADSPPVLVVEDAAAVREGNASARRRLSFDRRSVPAAVTHDREFILRSSGAMEIDPSELARVLRRVALAVDENTRLLSKINDLHREATELHGELGEALTDLEELLKRVEVE
jgi:hypothetical protein